MDSDSQQIVSLRRDLEHLNKEMIKCGFTQEDLKMICSITISSTNSLSPSPKCSPVFISLLICCVAFTTVCLVDYIQSIRCLLPNNYLVWEATRPISDCAFCEGINTPIILRNVTKTDFQKYAYSSKPIIVKGAIKHWKAMETFSFSFFKDLYEHTDGAYQSVEEGCQFLNFKSDLFSLQQVFSMSDNRAQNKDGEAPWYVGWGNCHPQILEKIRHHYFFPEFLPDDVEMPNSENIFFGFEQGAVMHVDYIPRLMWQGQVKGNKIWKLAPTPECDNVCQPFSFYVEPGDAVFLDTRIWFHATTIPKGQFSLTVQSEYG